MAITPPVDATKTPEWAALQKHYDELQSEGISLKQWFADDAERVEKLSFDAGDLHFDLSKNLIKPETLQLFADLAKAVKLDERTKAMYTGVHINNTEDRAVLHTALRRPVEDEGKYIVDGQDTVKDVREVLDRIYAFADKVRSGEWTGVTGKKIETVVNIGIGGSDLGPVMVYEALKPYADAVISARYISNIDPNDLAEKTKGLDPETTLFIIVSKTFTTLETLTNAREARTWLLEELKAKGAIDGFASAGSTGAMMVGSMYAVKPIEGVLRPTISSIVPTASGRPALLLDVGLNVDCKPEVLAQYGLIGSIYAEAVLGIERPRVAVLNIGEEETKGNAQSKAAYELLKAEPRIRFVGNVEGSHIFSGKVADVIVCDGFVGNTVLKMAEGLYRINKALGGGNVFWDSMNYENVGGTPVLGVNAPVIIGHGCSSPKAIRSMILSTEQVIKARLTAKLQQVFQNQ